MTDSVWINQRMSGSFCPSISLPVWCHKCVRFLKPWATATTDFKSGLRQKAACSNHMSSTFQSSGELLQTFSEEDAFI